MKLPVSPSRIGPHGAERLKMAHRGVCATKTGRCAVEASLSAKEEFSNYLETEPYVMLRV